MFITCQTRQSIDYTGFTDWYYVKRTEGSSLAINWLTFDLRKWLVWLIGSLLVCLIFPLPITNPFVLSLIRATTALPPGSVTVGLTDRVLLRLEQAERAEENIHFRADYQISWLTVKWSKDGVPDWSHYNNSSPFTAAVYQVLQCTPENVWRRILENRQNKLGEEYSDWYDMAGNLRPSSPKKPAASVGSDGKRKIA